MNVMGLIIDNSKIRRPPDYFHCLFPNKRYLAPIFDTYFPVASQHIIALLEDLTPVFGIESASATRESYSPSYTQFSLAKNKKPSKLRFAGLKVHLPPSKNKFFRRKPKHFQYAR